MIKLLVFVIGLKLFGLVFGGKEIELESFEPNPEYDPNYIEYGTVRATKKSRNLYVISGYFELKTSAGNEVLLSYDVCNEKGHSVFKGSDRMCDFVKNDKYVYPDLMKFSNLPEPGTCPLVKGNYTFNNLQLNVDRYPNLPPGMYTLKVWYALNGRSIGGYTVKSRFKYN